MHTLVLFVKGKGSQPDEYTIIKVKELEKVQHSKYLGSFSSFKSSNGTCLQGVKIRIAMAKQKMLQLNNV